VPGFCQIRWFTNTSTRLNPASKSKTLAQPNAPPPSEQPNNVHQATANLVTDFVVIRFTAVARHGWARFASFILRLG